MDDEDIDVADSPMLRLVDAGDLDGLLGSVSLDDIAVAWHRYSSAPEPKSYDHPDWWAVELFTTREIFKQTDLYIALLLKLVEHAADDDLSLGCVAAGPLENFVSDDEDDLRWLEAECRVNPRLREALLGVWCAGDVTDATLRRLDAAAGERLSRPRPASELLSLRVALQRLEQVAGGMAAFQQLANPSAEQRRAAEQVLAERRALRGGGAP